MKARPVAPSLVRSRIALAALFCATAFSIVAARLVDVMVFGAGPRTAGTASIAHPMRAFFGDAGGTCSVAIEASRADFGIASNAATSSPTLWNRSIGSFCKHRSAIATSSGGASAGNVGGAC